MRRTFLWSKIHRATVTETDVAYEGSLTLDPELMEHAGMLAFEKIEVYDVNNANRFSTYLIEGSRGSRECCVNGAAAHLVEIGDRLILCSFTNVEDSRVEDHRPRIVLVGDGNQIKLVKNEETAGARVEP